MLMRRDADVEAALKVFRGRILISLGSGLGLEEVRVRVGVRVRFAFCSLGFSFTEYIHVASFSMWCVRES